MQDRLSMYPGRVKLSPVIGKENVYDMERADEPQQLGTELKKDTLLSDETAEALGLTSDATPNTALAQIKTLIDELESKMGGAEYGSYTGTGTYGSSNPNKLTFPKAAKVVMLFNDQGQAIAFCETSDATKAGTSIYVPGLSTSYQRTYYYKISTSDCSTYMKRDSGSKKLFWYNLGSESTQFNEGSTKYYYAVFY